MKTGKKIIILIILSLVSIIFSASIGSVFISPLEIIKIFLYKIFNIDFGINKINADIVFNIRLSHAVLAFFLGSSLSMTGTVIQSILRNPLASAYNLGVSSAVGLGSALLTVIGAAYFAFVYISVGILFAFFTIVLILMISKAMDKYMTSNSIILAGIVISIFVSSIMSFLTYIFPKHASTIIFLQLGSLSLKSWNYIFIIIIISIIFLIINIYYSSVLDIITFGDDSAYSMGINVKKMRILFIIISSIITSILVSFAGIIGFIDLIAPHIARKLFSAKHIVVIPSSALIGGILLIFADILSRIIISGSNIPIGIITSIVGAPFFFYIFIRK